MQSASSEKTNGHASRPGATRVRHDDKFWLAAIAEQRASGKTIEAFCAERGVGRSTFQRWARRLGRPGNLSMIEAPASRSKRATVQSLPQFLEVPIAAGTSHAWVGQGPLAAIGGG